AICRPAPTTIHGTNARPGTGGARSSAIATPLRNTSANGSPNRKRTCVAPTVPSVVVNERCVALRTVWAKAAINVNTAHTQPAWIMAASVARLRPSGDQHVVDVHVGRELPAVGDQVVDHAGLVHHREAALLERDLELVRRDELVPLMRAARQPAQHVFGAHDGEREALQRAVDGGCDHQA